MWIYLMALHGLESFHSPWSAFIQSDSLRCHGFHGFWSSMSEPTCTTTQVVREFGSFRSIATSQLLSKLRGGCSIFHTTTHGCAWILKAATSFIQANAKAPKPFPDSATAFRLRPSQRVTGRSNGFLWSATFSSHRIGQTGFDAVECITILTLSSRRIALTGPSSLFVKMDSPFPAGIPYRCS